MFRNFNLVYVAKRFISAAIDTLLLLALIIPPTAFKIWETIGIFPFILYLVVVFIYGAIIRDAIVISLGKKVMRLSLRDKKSGKKPDDWKILIRNLLSPFWAIDVIGIFDRGQKFSDIFLGIEVVDDERKKKR